MSWENITTVRVHDRRGPIMTLMFRLVFPSQTHCLLDDSRFNLVDDEDQDSQSLEEIVCHPIIAYRIFLVKS